MKILFTARCFEIETGNFRNVGKKELPRGTICQHIIKYVLKNSVVL
jgi:hypothetical protein